MKPGNTTNQAGSVRQRQGEGTREVVREDAFIEVAMREHGASVLRLAFAQTHSKADAEDVYRDVFIALACDGTNFSDANHLRAWLLRVTINRCRNLARSWWIRHTTSMEMLEYDPPAPEESSRAASDPEAAAAVWQAVARLSPKLRAPIHLFYSEEMTCEEITQVLDIKH